MPTDPEVLAAELPAEVPPQSAAFFAMIQRLAQSPGAAPEMMERMYAIHKDMRAQDARDSYARCFARMQDQLPTITRSGRLRTRARDGSAALDTQYARFEDIVIAVRPILSSYGFAIFFKTKMTGGQITIVGTLMHEGGHCEDSEMLLPADATGGKNNVQAWGSSISYGKRYVMNALLNIVTEGEDTDGVPPQQQTEQARSQPRATTTDAKATEAQQRLIRARLAEAGMHADDFKAHFKIEHIADLRFEDVNAALEYIRDPQASHANPI